MKQLLILPLLILLGFHLKAQSPANLNFRGELIYSVSFSAKGEADSDGLLPDSLRIAVSEEWIRLRFTGENLPEMLDQSWMFRREDGQVFRVWQGAELIYKLDPKGYPNLETITTGERITVLDLKGRKAVQTISGMKVSRTLWIADSLAIPVTFQDSLSWDMPLLMEENELHFPVKMVNRNEFGSQIATLARIVPGSVELALPEGWPVKSFDGRVERLPVLLIEEE